MLHGMIYAKSAHNLGDDPGNDFAAEAHSYFGTGTQLQEMYITPTLLTPGNWDTIAEYAKWSRVNAETLKDSHWVGGDPLRLEPYGWASLSSHKGILTLRNPSDRPQSIGIDVASVLELPAGAATIFRAHDPFDARAAATSREFRAGDTSRVALAPFQVLSFELVAA
jgi:hypothetical protein